MQAGLPNVPVHDLVVHPRERELVAGTHGRSIWIVDVLPVQELDEEMMRKGIHVFPLEDVQAQSNWQSRQSRWFHQYQTPPSVTIPFWSARDGQASLEVLDSNGNNLVDQSVEARRGINYFEWNLIMDQYMAQAAEADRLVAMEDFDPDAEGARAKTPVAEALRLGWPLYVLPGDYTVRVVMGKSEEQTDLTIKAPRAPQPRQKPEPKIRGRK